MLVCVCMRVCVGECVCAHMRIYMSSLLRMPVCVVRVIVGVVVFIQHRSNKSL